LLDDRRIRIHTSDYWIRPGGPKTCGSIYGTLAGGKEENERMKKINIERKENILLVHRTIERPNEGMEERAKQRDKEANERIKHRLPEKHKDEGTNERMREQNRGAKKRMKGQSKDGRKNTRTNELTNG
jgi:hypothetical protein